MKPAVTGPAVVGYVRHVWAHELAQDTESDRAYCARCRRWRRTVYLLESAYTVQYSSDGIVWSDRRPSCLREAAAEAQVPA